MQLPISSMNVTVHHTKHLQQIQLYVALIEEIVIIFTDQMSWHQNIQQFTMQN